MPLIFSVYSGNSANCSFVAEAQALFSLITSQINLLQLPGFLKWHTWVEASARASKTCRLSSANWLNWSLLWRSFWFCGKMRFAWIRSLYADNIVSCICLTIVSLNFFGIFLSLEVTVKVYFRRSNAFVRTTNWEGFDITSLSLVLRVFIYQYHLFSWKAITTL